MTCPPARPSSAQIQAAAGKTVPDVIAPGLRVLFCGINPGLYSGAVGYHFARPGNRFWPALQLSGFTDRLLAPHEDAALLAAGCGITNLVSRATAAASELPPSELAAGGQALIDKIRRCQPRCLAVLGIGAYRTAFDRPAASLGRQPEAIDSTWVWLLPNPSGLNAYYQLADLAHLFAALRQALEPDVSRLR